MSRQPWTPLGFAQNIIVYAGLETWQLSFLRGADTKTKKMVYFILVRPILEYGCAAWGPYLSRDIKTLEQIQNRTLQFIFRLRGRVSFTDLRNKTNIESLKGRRKTVRLNLYYCKSVDNGRCHKRYPL